MDVKYELQLQKSLLTLKDMMTYLGMLEPLPEELVKEGTMKAIFLSKAMSFEGLTKDELQLTKSIFEELIDLMELNDQLNSKKNKLWDRYTTESRGVFNPKAYETTN